MKRPVVCMVCALAAGVVALAQSVVPQTGIPPRFPKADQQLERQTKPPSKDWLLDAPDDAERFRRLQVLAGGADIPMWEVSYRFEELHAAIATNNGPMGVYHLEKMRDRMNAAAMKRPARTQNLEGLFLDNGIYRSMHDALTSKDGAKMRATFNELRAACIACHAAEQVAFLNDSSVFQRIRSFDAAGR